MSPIAAPHTEHVGMVAAIRELVRLVQCGGQGTSTGEDGRRAISILVGMLQSNAAGSRPIEFPITDS
jgi:hypothetical protein